MKFVDRYLEVRIWPQDGIESYDFGRDWKITFRVRKNAGTDILNFNQAEIAIYNLNETTRNLLSGMRRDDFTGVWKHIDGDLRERISLEVGYQSKKGIIFDGIVQNVTTSKRGADLITTFFCCSSVVDYSKSVQLCVQNVALSDLIGQICKENGLSYDLNFTRKDVVSRSLSGSLGRVLSQLCYDYHLSMGIESGVTIFRDRLKTAQELSEADYILFTPNSGMLGNPTQTFQGINFKAFINPDLRINDYFKLYAPYADYNLADLTTNPQLVVGNQNNVPTRINTQTYNGTYLALRITYSGDTRGNDWSMFVEGSGLVTKHKGSE